MRWVDSLYGGRATESWGLSEFYMFFFFSSLLSVPGWLIPSVPWKLLISCLFIPPPPLLLPPSSHILPRLEFSQLASILTTRVRCCSDRKDHEKLKLYTEEKTQGKKDVPCNTAGLWVSNTARDWGVWLRWKGGGELSWRHNFHLGSNTILYQLISVARCQTPEAAKHSALQPGGCWLQKGTVARHKYKPQIWDRKANNVPYYVRFIRLERLQYMPIWCTWKQNTQSNCTIKYFLKLTLFDLYKEKQLENKLE